MRWRRLAVPGREEACASRSITGWHFTGELEVEEARVAARIRYGIECDLDWCTRSALVEGEAGGAPIRLAFAADGAGHWTADGDPVPGVSGCLDLDFGFTPATNTLPIRLSQGTDFETFFADAPRLNPSRTSIKGVICGVRLEEIEEPTMREIRYQDKLIDELAKGKAMEKILARRSPVIPGDPAGDPGAAVACGIYDRPIEQLKSRARHRDIPRTKK